jgi:hypothetical protein
MTSKKKDKELTLPEIREAEVRAYDRASETERAEHIKHSPQRRDELDAAVQALREEEGREL